MQHRSHSVIFKKGGGSIFIPKQLRTKIRLIPIVEFGRTSSPARPPLDSDRIAVGIRRNFGRQHCDRWRPKFS